MQCEAQEHVIATLWRSVWVLQAYEGKAALSDTTAALRNCAPFCAIMAGKVLKDRGSDPSLCLSFILFVLRLLALLLRCFSPFIVPLFLPLPV
ncbi:MAG: hypothetical protein DU429_08905 [Candidatus Tokpelaia sp.]|nr:MAG: hypothetical protein DU429_08905 [Candidatus Tokpelaia sp.]KAA6206584.1 MAG: hypothetical protein DU430_00390 [Candidatus Tokpelaia sp.]